MSRKRMDTFFLACLDKPSARVVGLKARIGGEQA
jgi:hypothetical protein